MSRKFRFVHWRRLAVGIALSAATLPAFAQSGNNSAALDGRVNALDQELANEMRALRQYLTYVDQTASIQIVLGRLTPAQAAQQLKRTAGEIYHNSFTQDSLGERRQEHIAAAEIMFKQIEARVAAAVRWPADRPGQDYRAFAAKELDTQWRLFRTLRAAPVPLHAVLSATLKIDAWTRGETVVPPAEDPFAKGDERVTAALTAQHVQHVKSLNEPTANTGRSGQGVFVPTVIPPTRSPGVTPSPPLPVEVTRGASPPPARSSERAPGIAVRSALTAEEEAELAKGRKSFMEQVQAASSRGVASATTAPLANPEPPPTAPRMSRIDDLPLAGLDASTQSSIRNAPTVSVPRTAAVVAPDANDAFAAALKLAGAAENKGDWAAASEHYRSAVELKPDSTIALQGLAETLDQVGRIEDSLAAYQRLQAIAPKTPGVALKMAQLHVSAGDLANAEKEAERAVLAEPNSALAMSWLGTVELLQGERHMAAASFQRATQLDARVIEQRYQAAVRLLAAGQARRSATDAVTVLTMSSNHHAALFIAGESYFTLGSRDRAVAYFQRYLERDPAGAHADRARRRLQELGVR